MISKQELKLIKSLQSKKHRDHAGLFLVEGEKSLAEVLQSDWEVELVLATTEFIFRYSPSKNKRKSRIIEADRELLHKTGTLTTNEAGVAVVKIPEEKKYIEPAGRLILAIENMQDPGNLGTLLRIADWYGIKEVLLSEGSVDVFNPKVIQASMGSFLRVNVFYSNLERIFRDKKIPLTGTFPEGESIYHAELPEQGYILLGNESKGISQLLAQFVDHKLAIPRFGKAESLNVAIAAAVILDNFKRKAV
jgi:RNA methyltransferase, TrmH family